MQIVRPVVVLFITIWLSAVADNVLAGTPISGLSVTLRGQKYDVSDVTTVHELQEQVSTLSGIAIRQQGRVIYGGKKLPSETILSEAGVPNGSNLNIVPSTSSKKKKSKTAVASSKDESSGTKASLSSSSSSASASNPMADLLKNSGIDQKDLDEMMKSMGAGGAGGPKSMEEGMKAMQEAMKSPILQQMLQDPEKLEQSRQMILNNPMLKGMMSNMPGMNELLNDKDSWRQAMQMAAELYKNMDSDTLMKAMMGGAETAQKSMLNDGLSSSSGTAGIDGMFDGSTLFNDSSDDDDKITSAFDELDEDD